MISLIYDVKKYREFLGRKVKKDDVVIEIGPHKGKSTERYAKKVKLGVLVDKSVESKESLEKLLEEHKNLKFIHGDARKFETVRKALSLTKRCDVLAVDLGGGRYPDTVFKVWAIWSGVFKPRNSVIRNRGLAEFIRKVKIEDDELRKTPTDDGWLSEYGRAIPSELKKQLKEFEFWVRV